MKKIVRVICLLLNQRTALSDLILSGWRPPGHGCIIPKRWACVIDVKKKKKKKKQEKILSGLVHRYHKKHIFPVTADRPAIQPTTYRTNQLGLPEIQRKGDNKTLPENEEQSCRKYGSFPSNFRIFPSAERMPMKSGYLYVCREGVDWVYQVFTIFITMWQLVLQYICIMWRLVMLSRCSSWSFRFFFFFFFFDGTYIPITRGESAVSK